MSAVHPFTVHLPIGLLLGSFVFAALAARTGERGYDIAGYHCLRFGWLALLPAVAAGLWDASRFVFGTQAPHADALGLVNAHAAAGVAVMLVFWQVWQVRRRNPNLIGEPSQQRRYLIWMGLGTALLVLSGWLGGQLVYVEGVGVQPGE